MMDIGYWILDIGYWILDIGSGFLELERSNDDNADR